MAKLIGRARRFAPVDLMRRARARGVGAGGRIYLLDLVNGGTFTRSTASFYQTSASTVAEALADVRCIENVGNVEGALISLERQWTQIIDTPRDITGAGWSAKGVNASTTVDAGNGPDGSAVADRSDVTGGLSGSFSAFNTTAGVTTAIPYTASLWIRAFSGTSESQITWFRSTSVGQVDYRASIGETWGRRQLTDQGAGTSLSLIIHEGRVISGLGTIASSGDVLSDLHNVVQGAYAFRPVSLGAGSVVAPDTLTFSAYDARLLTALWSTRIYPKWATTDLVSGDERWLYSWDGSNDGIRIRHDGTAPRVELLDGGVVVMNSAYIGTVEKNGEHRISFDLPNARIIHNDTGGPVGTTPAWGTPTNLRVGGIFGALAAAGEELDGRMTAPYLGLA